MQTDTYHHPMSALPPPPVLRSRNQKASWVNRAGRVDRSACFEVRASELWPRISRDLWKVARTSTGREAAAEITVTARMLRHLHDSRPPQQLVGDWRTGKSNAMKDERSSPRTRRKAQGWPSLGFAGDLSANFAPNPNKGATRTKKLALWGAGQIGFPDRDWEQLVKVERWERKRKGTKARRHKGTKGNGHFVPSSLRASVPPSHQHFLTCPQCKKKMLKLMMVLATEREVDDAEIAEGWVRMIDAHPRRDFILNNDPALSAHFSELVSRYGLLFRGRRLICRNCLGVRYGEVKPKRRLKKDLVIIKNPFREGKRKRKPKQATKLTHDERAALRKLKDVMKSIRKSNDIVKRFTPAQKDAKRQAGHNARSDQTHAPKLIHRVTP